MEKRDDKRLDPVLSWVLGGDKQTEQHSRELVRAALWEESRLKRRGGDLTLEVGRFKIMGAPGSGVACSFFSLLDFSLDFYVFDLFNFFI